MTQFNPSGILGRCLLPAADGGPKSVFARTLSGDLVHVDDVARSTPDLKCPDCGSELRVRKCRPGRADHFYHLSARECRTAGETAVHMLAKEIIASSMMVRLPVIAVDLEEEGGWVCEIFRRGSWRKVDWIDPDWVGPKLELGSVRMEVWQDGVRPDLIASDLSERDLYIEVRVSHAVDEKK